MHRGIEGLGLIKVDGSAKILRGKALDLAQLPLMQHAHQLDAQRRQQVQVMRQMEKPPVGNHFAAEGNDKNLAAESVNIRCDRLEPVDESILGREARTRGNAPFFRVLPGLGLFFLGGNGSLPVRLRQISDACSN